MKRHSLAGSLVLSIAVTGLFTPLALASQDAVPGQADVTPQEPKVLTLEDYGRWSTIGQVALSANGRWMTFSYAPNDGDSKLFLRDLDNVDEDPVELSVNGTGPVFSDDSRLLAFIASPGEGGGRSGGGADRGGGGDEAEGQTRTRTLHLMDLTSDERWEVEGPSSFSFSDDSQWFAVHKSGAGGGGGAAAGRGGPGGGP